MRSYAANLTKTFVRNLFFTTLLLMFCMASSAQMRRMYEAPLENYHITSISFYSGSAGYACFSNRVFFTADSGRSFVQKPIGLANVNFGSYPNVNITFGFAATGIKAFDQNKLIAYGHYGFVPSILRSIDGGDSWTLVLHSQYDPNVLSGGIASMDFAPNGQTGYAVDADRVLKTINQGQSWSVVYVNPRSYFNNVQAVDNSTVYVFSNDYERYKLIKSSNSGLNWQQLSIPSLGKINYVNFLTPDKGWLTMYGEYYEAAVYYTSNGGISWTLKNDPVNSPFSCVMMKFVNDSTGYSINGTYDTYKTTDSGKVWQRLPRDNNYEYLSYYHLTMHFFNSDQFWSGGAHGFLEMTTNGGGTPYPRALFRIDTVGVAATNTVKLINLSKPGYIYSWYKNDTLISNSYNASFTHEIHNPKDSIKLIVSDGMHADTTVKAQRYTVPEVPPPPQPYTGWTAKATNIIDDLLDIRMYGNNGLLLGKKGLYYTTTGLDDPNGWKKYTITGSGADSSLLARTKFNDIAFNNRNSIFYACGSDTVNGQAIIFRIDPSNLQYKFIYIGPTGTRLNSMVVLNSTAAGNGYLYAVGDKGMYLNYYIHNTELFVSYLPGQPKLNIILSRAEGDLAVFSDSVLYIGGGNTFNINYSVNTGHHVTGSAAVATFVDMIITDTMVYRMTTVNNATTYQAMNRVKSLPGLRYNAISTAWNRRHKFLSTNQGIYRLFSENPVASGTETIEWQPTSLRQPVTNIWFMEMDSIDKGFAVGPAGQLYVTSNLGGPTVPYAEARAIGNCAGSATILNGLSGTGTSCKWYVNDVLRSSSCSNASISIPDPGIYQLKYIVGNVYGMYDTSYTTIYINAPPVVNLPTEVSDTVLCKSERVLVSLQNTQTGYRYDLIKESSRKSFGRGNGNGSVLNFLTDSISETGYYLINATDVNGGCSKDFTEKIFIRVEHTKSAFVSDRINVSIGETVRFSQHSIESNLFKWTLPADASVNVVTGSTTPDISFSVPGQKALTLVSTSNAGCADTITSNAVFVYAMPSEEKCYTMVINDSDHAYYPEAEPYINELVLRDNNGVLVSGGGNNSLLRSRYGNEFKIRADASSFLAAYTTNGVLSWFNYIKKNGDINGTATDEQGNIYIVGDLQVHSAYYFSNGDSIMISTTPVDTVDYHLRRNGFILKLDKNGNYLWHTVVCDPADYTGGFPTGAGAWAQIKIHKGHIIVAGSALAKLSYCRNGVIQPLYSNANSISVEDTRRHYILKIKNDGTLLWHMNFQVDPGFVNRKAFDALGIDGKGNLYVAGLANRKFIIKDVNNNTLDLTLPGFVQTSYVLKFDSLGQFKWRCGTKQYGGIRYHEMHTDEDGNNYIGGSAGAYVLVPSFLFYNSDGSTSTVNVGQAALFKIDSAGILRWSVGSQYSYYGEAASVFLKGDKLYITGTVRENGGIPESVYTMTSTDGNHVTMPFLMSEIYIAEYDTAGVLKRIAKSGTLPLGYASSNSIRVDSNDNILVAGRFQFLNGDSPTIFGMPVPLDDGLEVYFIKLNPDFCYSTAPLIAQAGPDKQTCASQSVSIGTPALAGGSYYWTSNPAGFVSTLANPTVNPSVTTTYYLSVYNQVGMVRRDTVLVNVLANPIANAGPDSVICAGTAITLGTPAVAGNVYSWTSVNGFNSSDAQITVNPTISTTYYLKVLSGNGCAAFDTVNVKPQSSLVSSVTIVRQYSSGCAGSITTFTATPVNGGPSPAYQWMVNGQNVGTNSNVYSAVLANLDQVKVQMTSSLSCAAPAVATSNILSVNLIPQVTPTVTINTPSLNICTGYSVMFTSTVTNSGFPAIYQWKKNGQNVGNGGANYTDNSPASGDKYWVELTSSAQCTTIPTVVSNTLTITLVPVVTPSVSIIGSTTVIQGQTVTLTALALNAGPSPSYSWYDSTNTHNWQEISGAFSPQLVYAPKRTGDKVRCMIYGTACQVTMQATSAPLVFSVSIPTGIGIEPATNYHIRNYPNPVQTVLTIDSLKLSDKWQTLDIVSLDGKNNIIQLQIQQMRSISVNVESLVPGFYAVILRRESGTAVYLKFIKM